MSKSKHSPYGVEELLAINAECWMCLTKKKTNTLLDHLTNATFSVFKMEEKHNAAQERLPLFVICDVEIKIMDTQHLYLRQSNLILQTSNKLDL